MFAKSFGHKLRDKYYDAVVHEFGGFRPFIPGDIVSDVRATSTQDGATHHLAKHARKKSGQQPKKLFDLNVYLWHDHKDFDQIFEDTYLDIEELLSEYGRSLIDWCTGTIEHSTKHFNAHGHAEDITREFTSSVQVINSCSAFENLEEVNKKECEIMSKIYAYLYDGLFSLDLENLALSHGTVS